MEIKTADRLSQLPPYLFKEIDRLKAEAVARGVDVINVSIGDPDRPTPERIVSIAQKALADPANHPYPSSEGMAAFKEAVSRWAKRRFGLDFDPSSEVVSLIGSKEAVFHFPLAFVNPGEVVLCPSPAYPVYKIGTLFAGGEPYEMPLLAENGFFPDFKAIPADIIKRAKLMWLNYPNNPTSALATIDQFKEVVEFAKANGIIVVHDAAYVDMTFEGYIAPSFMETPGAMDCAIEMHSFSKPFQMTGWRVGMAVGNSEIIKGLAGIKSNVDSGVPQAIQYAAITALETSAEDLADNLAVYTRRRAAIVPGLEKMGLEVWPTKGTFYIWARVPEGLTSADWATRLLTEAGVVVTPGNGFGDAGEGWFRIALSAPQARLEEAVARMEKLVL